MKCERVEELLIDYLSGEIDPAENRLVENHLQKCHGCSTKLSEFREIQSAFQSEILPEPSKEVLESLTIKAKQDLNKEKISFWKKWFYTPVLIPTLTTAMALMIWINYTGDNTSEFGDQQEYYSREVMAEKVPSSKFADNNLGAEGSGRIQARDEFSDVKQNADSPELKRAAREYRRDATAAGVPAANEQEPSYKRMRSISDDISSDIIAHNGAPSPANKPASNDKQSSPGDFGNYESESTKHGQSSASREEILAELKSEQPSKGQYRIAGTNDLVEGGQEKAKPQSPASDTKQDDNGFSFSLGSSKVMAKKVQQPSSVMDDKDLDIIETEDSKELADSEGLDYTERAKISEQVRSAEKSEAINKSKLEDSRFTEVDSPKEIADKAYLKELNVALSQQKEGDCESAIKTNEYNLKNSPDAPDGIKEQTYLSLAQCYEQQNMFVKAIENYNYLQRVAPTQKSFATQKIDELNFKVQQLGVPATISEPTGGKGAETEVTK